jgi:dTDP-4-amino-4,6-dideoxygalactose transaminase
MIIPFYDLGTFYKAHKASLDLSIQKVMESGRWMDGPETAACEKKLAALFNKEWAVTTGSCTDALYFTLVAAGIREGDEVIVPAFSFIASLTPILRTGAIPVFVDIPESGFIPEVAQIEASLTKKTKAILAVHLFGQCPAISEISDLAQRNGLLLIEDGAQAIHMPASGPTTFASNALCLSFDPTKVVNALGTGGAVLTNDTLLAEKVRAMRMHGKVGADYPEAGYNSRITEYQAAGISLQLDELQATLEVRRAVAENYLELLSSIEGLVLPTATGNVNWHKFVVRTEKRDALRDHLKAKGIETMIHYPTPLCDYGLCRNMENALASLPNTRLACSQVLSLPIYESLKAQEIQYVCDTIKTFFTS